MRRKAALVAHQQIVKQFVQYIITDGQSSAESLQYSKLPAGLAEQDEKLLAQIEDGATQSSSTHPDAK